MEDKIRLSIIIPVYNEEENIFPLYSRLNQVISDLQIVAEYIFVNDGSNDNSKEIINKLAANGNRVKAIHFSRNYGHESAMLAGIDKSCGAAVICMDADLQHPPEKIAEMYKAFEQGFEIVNMVRTERKDNGFLKKISSKLFYFSLNILSPVKFHESASDFFLVSNRVAKILKIEFRERTRFLRGFIQIVGFKKTILKYTASNRETGVSKYSFSKLLTLSLGAIVSFSKLPLHLGLVMGVIFGVFALIIGIFSIIIKLTGGAPPGYTTIVVLISILFSIQFFLIGIIGVYIGYLYEENKKRPIYIIEEEVGFSETHL